MWVPSVVYVFINWMRSHDMKCKSMLISVSIAISLSVFAAGVAISASPDKYTVKVPNGLAFSEFKG
jgi:hypothetical protein